MVMVDTICMRCGYPHRVPCQFRDRIKTCPQCSTAEENVKRLEALERIGKISGCFRYSKYHLFNRAFELIMGRKPTAEEYQVSLKLKKGFPDD